MSRNSQINRLRELAQKAERIRTAVGISKAGEVLFKAPESLWSENDVVVEADGFGGAKLLIVEGNYPIDYLIKSEQKFSSEEKACEAAERLGSAEVRG